MMAMKVRRVSAGGAKLLGRQACSRGNPPDSG
jgi:hypothetical protein